MLLKKFLATFFFFLFAIASQGQNLYLKAEGSTSAETRVIDSLGYKYQHLNAKGINEEAAKLYNNILSAGYLAAKEPVWIKTNDSSYIYRYSLGARTKTLLIATHRLTTEQKNLLAIPADTLTVPLSDSQGFMDRNLALLEKKGYALSRLQLVNQRIHGNSLLADLTVFTEKKRSINNIVIEGYPKFPEGIRRNIARQYKKKAFSRETLERVYKDFAALRFVSQPRYPEILFKTDTTKVYVYLEKAKPNTFDGFIGFANNEEKGSVRFNGYIDLLLNNILNSGEKFNLYWKSDGNKQTTFNAALELPYLFSTPLGAKGSLRIFKQDSTFQNTVTDINIGYYFSYNSKLYLGRQKTESVDIQNQDTASLADFTNAFWTGTFEYAGYTEDDFLFPQKTSIFFKAGAGRRTIKTARAPQYFAQANIWHNFYLNRHNSINLKNQTFYLDSSTYIINELFRFGGINSIRGFNENSLQASLYSAIMAEYRYVLSEGLYIHSITDYGFFQDKSSSLQNNLLAIGFGFGILTRNGLLNLIYANGSTGEQQVKLSNSIVHISFKTSF